MLVELGEADQLPFANSFQKIVRQQEDIPLLLNGKRLIEEARLV
jgi:hypothetical protein